KKKSNPKPLIVLTPENEKRVETATRRGVEYLKRQQTTQGPNAGAWEGEFAVGFTALAGLTLLESNVPASHPSVKLAAAFLPATATRCGTTTSAMTTPARSLRSWRFGPPAVTTCRSIRCWSWWRGVSATARTTTARGTTGRACPR